MFANGLALSLDEDGLHTGEAPQFPRCHLSRSCLLHELMTQEHRVVPGLCPVMAPWSVHFPSSPSLFSVLRTEAGVFRRIAKFSDSELHSALWPVRACMLLHAETRG